MAELSRRCGIDPWILDDPREASALERLRAAEPDLLLSFYYRGLLPEAMLQVPRLGAFNVHGSLLPKFRGRAPVNWAILKGETRTGATLHRMRSRADTGEIVDQEAVPIGPDDTALEVQRRVTDAAVAILARRLDELKAGTAPAVPQDESAATRFGRRRPEDGRIDWSRPAREVHDLVRAVTHPYPGAFTDLFDGKTFVWRTRLPGLAAHDNVPRTGPDGGGAAHGGLRRRPLRGATLASVGGARGDRRGRVPVGEGALMRVLILGVNGFIGNALTERILETTDWHVSGLDVGSDKIAPFLGSPRFTYLEGDIAINKEWIEYQIKKCDVVLPLVAIATPAAYVKQPLAVFELDFEENLRIVKQAVRYRKRVVFPSTSEVYGMCADAEFDEDSSPLVYGPIQKQRWIYSCSKQLLDRVIWAYGERGLQFTLFRPFNWFGPHLDDIDSPKEGSSRVLTQFLHNILYGEPIKLVDGGTQRRSFTYISDGIDALMAILENKDGAADGGIFNVGNPANDLSIAELARRMIAAVSEYPGFEEKGAERADRRRDLRELLRQRLSGHPDPRALDPARPGEAGLEAAGGARGRHPAHPRLLPQGPPSHSVER